MNAHQRRKQMRRYGRETGLEAIPFRLLRLATVEPVQAVELSQGLGLCAPSLPHPYSMPSVVERDRIPAEWHRFCGWSHKVRSFLDGVWGYYRANTPVEAAYYQWRERREADR